MFAVPGHPFYQTSFLAKAIISFVRAKSHLTGVSKQKIWLAVGQEYGGKWCTHAALLFSLSYWPLFPHVLLPLSTATPTKFRFSLFLDAKLCFWSAFQIYSSPCVGHSPLLHPNPPAKAFPCYVAIIGSLVLFLSCLDCSCLRAKYLLYYMPILSHSHQLLYK